MSKILTLPSGNTITVKEEKEYTLKDRKFVLRDLRKEDLDNIGDMLEILERIIIVSVTEWTFDLIPPNIQPESLDGLKLDDIDAMNKFARKSLSVIMPNFIDDGDEADPKVTPPSSAA